MRPIVFARTIAFLFVLLFLALLSTAHAQQQVSGQKVIIANVVVGSSPIAYVQFYLDSMMFNPPVTTSPYQTNWNTTGYTNGPHTVSVMVFDVYNLSGSNSLPVIVNNATTPVPPTVTITIPQASSTVTGKTTVQAYATPTGSATIANLILTIAGSQRASYNNVGGFSYSWNTAPDKKKSPATIAVSARDSNGLSGSQAIVVKIQ